TATSDILRVIASSPTDALPVLNAIVQSAVRLSSGETAIARVRDGEGLRNVAAAGPRSSNVPLADGGVVDRSVRPFSERLPSVRAFLERRTIHAPDRADPAFLAEFPDSRVQGPETSLT